MPSSFTPLRCMIDSGTSAPSWLFTLTSVVTRSVGAPNFPSGCSPVLVALPEPSTAKISVARVQARRVTIAPSAAGVAETRLAAPATGNWTSLAFRAPQGRRLSSFTAPSRDS